MAENFSDPLLGRIAAGLAPLLARWGLPEGTDLRLLNLSENATFKATPPGGAAPLVLRVHRRGYHRRAEIAAELDWIDALRRARVLDTPAIVPALDGRRILRLDLADGARHVVAFAFAPGTEPAPGSNLVPGFRELGAISARLHAHARHWPRPAGFVRKSWTFDTAAGPAAHWGDWRSAPGLTPEGAALLGRLSESLRADLARWGTGPDRFGLIHADLRLANLLDNRGRLTVIDFDDCGFGWFLFDFAASVSFMETSPALPDLAAAWAEGYRRVAPLSPEAEAMLPAFVMLRRLQLTAWIASHAETPTAQAMGPAYTAGTLDLADAFLHGAGPGAPPRA